MHERLRRLGAAYRTASVIFMTAAVALVLVNALIALVYSIAVPQEPPTPWHKYGASLSRLYPGMSDADLRQLLTETWSRRPVYSPLVEFREAPFKGQFVNVADAGFRLSAGQEPWPPRPGAFNVFFFGGSTTFGYGVADADTIASRFYEDMKRAMPAARVAVYNFGSAYYFSAQERVLFESLLQRGPKPHLVVFLDGLNELIRLDGGTAMSERLRAFLGPPWDGGGAITLQALRYTPMARVARDLRPRTAVPRLVDASLDDALDEAYGRYEANRAMSEAVCSAFGVKPLFVWQPVPTYKYDLTQHAFFMDHVGYAEDLRIVGRGYERIARAVALRPLAKSVLWLADMQERLHEPLYVDQAHYSAGMSDRIAARLVQAVLERGMLQ